MGAGSALLGGDPVHMAGDRPAEGQGPGSRAGRWWTELLAADSSPEVSALGGSALALPSPAHGILPCPHSAGPMQ